MSAGPQRELTPKEKFIMALEGKQPPGLVPHFELVFYLTQELLGKKHPSHQDWTGWEAVSGAERARRIEECALIYLHSAERMGHSAIFFQAPSLERDFIEMARVIREHAGDRFFIMVHGDATFSIPNGEQYMEFVYNLADKPDDMKAYASKRVKDALARGRRLVDGGIDGFALCADYCFNQGPFLSPEMFHEFVYPYLGELVAGYKDMGIHVIKHTDGDIRPILDMLVDTEPHALHSLDPQGNVDIREVKAQYGKRLCLIGNVNCGLMDTGTDEEVIASAEYCLTHAMPGGGYIFSTSNCIYPGMPMRRYELILDVWKRLGVYPG